VRVRQLLPVGLVVGMLASWGSPSHTQQPAAAVDVATLGPQVGTVVPPISGIDQFGKAHTLATLSGPKGLMLVFSRSADW